MKSSSVKKLLDIKDLDPDYQFYKSLMLTAKEMEEMKEAFEKQLEVMKGYIPNAKVRNWDEDSLD